MPLLTGRVSDFLKIGVAAAGRGDLETVRTVLAERPDCVALRGAGGVCGYCFPASRSRRRSRFAR